MATTTLQLSLTSVQDLRNEVGNIYRKSTWTVRYLDKTEEFVVVNYNDDSTYLRIDPISRIFASQKRLIGLYNLDDLEGSQVQYLCCNLFDRLDRPIPFSEQIENQQWADIANHVLAYITSGDHFTHLTKRPINIELFMQCAAVVNHHFPYFQLIEGLPAHLHPVIAETGKKHLFIYDTGTEMSSQESQY